MKTTTEIIKNCFKKAKMENIPSDRTAYLFKLLCDEMNEHFIKRKPKEKEKILFDEIMGGYSMTMGDYTIVAAQNCYETVGANKDIAVLKSWGDKPRGFSTIKGAMKYVEDNA